MVRDKVICVAGKNSIGVGGLNYIWEKFNNNYEILVLCDENDKGIDGWQPSLLKFAKKLRLRIVQLDQLYDIKSLFFISLEYHKLIDTSKFITNDLYNLHFSLLPAYKGMYTSAHPILNHEEISGCTLHRIDEGIDTGEVIFQKSFMISVRETGRSLYDKYTKYGLELVEEKVSNLIEDNFEKIQQSSSGASYFSKSSINYDNLTLNTKCTASQLIAQIKAYSFRDYQLPCLFGKPIFGYSVLNNRSNLKAGDLVNTLSNKFTIATVDYDVDLYFDNFENILQAVCNANEDKVISSLKNNKFVINERNQQGWTPLIISLYNGYNNITSILLNNGADPNKCNNKGTTPLMYAKDCAQISGDTFGLEALLKHNASTKNRDIYNLNIFDYLNASSINYKKIKLLLNAKEN